MLEIWTVYHFVGYDLQINLAHELLVYYVCGKLDSLYKFSIDIYRCWKVKKMRLNLPETESTTTPYLPYLRRHIYWGHTD